MRTLLPAISTFILAWGVAVGGVSEAQAATPTPCPPDAANAFVCLDFTQGQTPENVTQEPSGALDVSFSVARQIAQIGRDRSIRVLATMPKPADGGVHTPVLHFAATMGLTRASDGTLYYLYAAGSADLTGVWRVTPGGAPQRIAALPADSLPNGIALNEHTGTLYIADSAPGRIWSVPTTGGPATLWSTDPDLASTGYLGANGVKLHDGAVWVSNTDQGTIVRIPIQPNGTAARPTIWASALPSIDDFAFINGTNKILAAENHTNTIVRVDPDGTQTTELTPSDGLQNPTSLLIHGDYVIVMSAAYATHKNPNILIRRLRPLAN